MKLIAAFIILGIGLVYWSVMLKQRERDRIHRGWLRLPVVDKYNQRNPLSRSGRNGSACCYCGSRSIRQLGLEARNDQRRVHACNHCNANLYRTYR
ncbi:hypothetical protein [Pseudomonas sp.]|jgi:type II secretory pathway component PulF|uniref:hypothetical protein n=1 Tax=Pseudomonas sp. TaxID=306 RepID=UPI0027317816|nr:hypothetical protein [Pseudomonas sp.]MDP2243556.1 hypothetical protein [Pseudomonas sp.]